MEYNSSAVLGLKTCDSDTIIGNMIFGIFCKITSKIWIVYKGLKNLKFKKKADRH